MILLTLLLFAQAPSGATIFENNCATCHAGTDPRVPTVAALRQRMPESIVEALTIGAMRPCRRASGRESRAHRHCCYAGRAPHQEARLLDRRRVDPHAETEEGGRKPARCVFAGVAEPRSCIAPKRPGCHRSSAGHRLSAATFMAAAATPRPPRPRRPRRPRGPAPSASAAPIRP